MVPLGGQGARGSVEMECGALLFDLDGVLVDSRVVIERHWTRWAVRHGLDVATVLEAAPGRRTIETIRRVAPQLDAVREATDLAAAEAPDTDGLVAMEGAFDLLSGLPAEVWGVVTSGIRITAETRLRHAGLPIPAVLVSADDVTSGKPDPEGYLTGARRLGTLPSECVVIEDTPAGLEAGRTAGMRTIGLVFQYTSEELSEADRVIRRLTDLRIEMGEGAEDRLRLVLRASS